MSLPWQQKQWEQLKWLKKQKRLPHALLFVGIEGTGKTQFTKTMIHALLCQFPNDNFDFCHKCHACRLIEGNTHPNVMWITPEKPGQAIKIDQVRDMDEFVNQSSLQGEYRIVVITPAERMNVNAANALLKLLEEPAAGAIIILISDQNKSLPSTILSRCQRIVFSRPQKAEALAWMQSHIKDSNLDFELLLKLANGAPLAALSLASEEKLSIRRDLLESLCCDQYDPIQIANMLADGDVLQLLDFILSWLVDLLQLQLEGSPDRVVNQDYKNQLIMLTKKTNLKNNLRLMLELQQLRGQICNGINFNKQLLIESVLIKWKSDAKTLSSFL